MKIFNFYKFISTGGERFIYFATKINFLNWAKLLQGYTDTDYQHFDILMKLKQTKIKYEWFAFVPNCSTDPIDMIY